jgi:xanthine dehydrogenase large subunit
MTAHVHAHAHAHDSAAKHVSGQAHYIDDLVEPVGTLHLQFGLSERAHANIIDMDLSAVISAPGVVRVLTVDDIPGHNDVSPWAGDDPLFAPGRVMYVGQALFAVVAITRAQARAAAKLGKITYQDLPAYITIDQALAADSLLEPPYVMGQGDPDTAIAAAPRQCSGTLTIGGQEHFYLEGQAALVVPGEDGDMMIYSSSQHPTEIQHKVAHVLGVPFANITVEVRRMGGGFGGKESQGNLPAAACALAAKLTGHAVKCRYDRDDDFMLTGKRHDFKINYRVGFDEQGRLLGLIFDHALRCGMSFDLSQAIGDRAMFHADNCYYVPNLKITSRRCLTHTQSATAFRGFGGPQGMLGVERVMDAIAHELSMDPLIVRRLNFYPHHLSEATPSQRLTHYGMTVSDCIIQDIVDQLVISSDYERRRADVMKWNKTNDIIKRGISLSPLKFGISFTKTMFNQAGALLHLYTDGSFQLNHGGTEMGQGLYIKVAQVVACAFHVPVETIKITATTTGKVPNTSATSASSGADLNAMAALDAAQTIQKRLVAFLAAHFSVSESEIYFSKDGVHIGRQVKTLAEVATLAYGGRVQLSATGFYATPKITWDRTTATGRPFYYFAYGASVSEVAIDTLTGESRILRVDILHDAGRSLNPAIDLGQVEGGFVQGAGWLTTEELVYNDQGKLMTHAPSTYKIPTCGDRAPIVNIALFDAENHEDTVHKSKAVGEPPLMLANSVFLAILDAVRQALPSNQAPILHAPATPEQILRALGQVH